MKAKHTASPPPSNIPPPPHSSSCPLLTRMHAHAHCGTSASARRLCCGNALRHARRQGYRAARRPRRLLTRPAPRHSPKLPRSPRPAGPATNERNGGRLTWAGPRQVHVEAPAAGVYVLYVVGRHVVFDADDDGEPDPQAPPTPPHHRSPISPPTPGQRGWRGLECRGVGGGAQRGTTLGHHHHHPPPTWWWGGGTPPPPTSRTGWRSGGTRWRTRPVEAALRAGRARRAAGPGF
jgi:hypothetical protein